MPLVEILPPPIGTDYDLALVIPSDVVTQRFDAQADPKLIDAIVEGVSRDDTPHSDPEDEASRG